jgi:hypothetical protein
VGRVELFPLQFRAKIMSVCLTLQYLVNFLLVKFFGNIAASGGAYAPFAMFAGKIASSCGCARIVEPSG